MLTSNTASAPLLEDTGRWLSRNSEKIMDTAIFCCFLALILMPKTQEANDMSQLGDSLQQVCQIRH